MNGKYRKVVAGGLVLAAAIAGFCSFAQGEKTDTTAKTTESSVVTNDNGSVTRYYTESNVSTNGSLVTERRRETRTTTDASGNVLATSTSEYLQSYPAGAGGFAVSAQTASVQDMEEPVDSSGFLGLRFGDVWSGDVFAADPAEPTLLKAAFTPAKALAGFGSYTVYVTPTTKRIAKIVAGAKEAVEPQARGRRNYLIEALEKRYRTWARPCHHFRPIYRFDIGNGRSVVACLRGASNENETEIVAWDGEMLTLAADETEAKRNEARKAAAERRAKRIEDAAEAF
ncbi:MAG: hypothetical protein K6F50_06425 [Kiritimatiellae bacterium]|nr:hypothetical protein [Kiritimatiellia bacterium]